jgi:DNA-binding NtrC family response regulator
MPADLIGAHPALQKLKSSLPVLGARQTPLVIIGESGVGKSLVAAHVHQHSERRHRAPDILNASTLDERDQRIRLFGGEPTILTTTRKSILENPTTVVLKHLDHLRPHLQNELAKALVTQEVQRPGSDTYRAILCRPIVTLREPPEKLLKKKRLSAFHHCGNVGLTFNCSHSHS